jgi:hypothetical protein
VRAPHLDDARFLHGLQASALRGGVHCSKPADLVVELDGADVIWSGGGAVATSPVDVYRHALSMFTPVSSALSCTLPHRGRQPVALELADHVCP